MGTDSGDLRRRRPPGSRSSPTSSLETHSLFRNLGGGLFADVTSESGVGPATLPFVGFGVAFFDYDNDADLDIAIANGHVMDNAGHFRPAPRYAQRNLLLRNDGDGRFADVGRQAGPGFGAGEGGPRRSRPATSTTTAIWICWSPTTARRPTCSATTAARVRAMRSLIRLRGGESNRDGIGAMRHGHGRVPAAGSRGACRVQLPRAE